MNRRANISKYLKMYKNDPRFSGADGQYLESGGNGGMADLAFAPDDLSANGVTPANVSKPYILFITNTSGVPLDALIFGQSRNLLLPNQGNPAGIVITTPAGITYPQLLNQSATQPFDIGQWKITSTAGSAQLDNEVLVEYFDANRRTCSDPIDVNKDGYQYDPNQVVFWYPVKIDGNTQLSYTVLGHITVTLKLYPRTVAVPSRPLINSPAIKPLATPRITGLNSVAIDVTAANAGNAGGAGIMVGGAGMAGGAGGTMLNG